jgi:hypothetical protein
MTKTKKQILAEFRKAAKQAASARLRGHMQNAVAADNYLETLYRYAKSEGVSEDECSLAEESGRAAARRKGA